MERVLVTGGAGYIGSHACKALAAAGYLPVAYDNLTSGREAAVRYGPLERGDLLDAERLAAVFTVHRPVAVMHFAALSEVGQSVREPGRYWRVNVSGSLNLVEASLAAGCRSFVFSSTCATYGEHDGIELTEETPQNPVNPYGASKRAIEDMLRGFEASHGLRHVIFRYFNVAGADPDGELGECHEPETHLIPLMLEAIDGLRPALTVFGDDYDTPDGTCIRDYVHVSDLVDAHVLGLRWLAEGGGSRVFNLGTGRGFSVREVIEHSRIVTNRAVPHVIGPRRPGDCARLVCGGQSATDTLGWRPERSNLSQMIADAWRWHRSRQGAR